MEIFAYKTDTVLVQCCNFKSAGKVPVLFLICEEKWNIPV